MGLLTATIAGQEFWQVAWALKKKDVSRTFLWAGAWFYPIPICLGLLGLTSFAELDRSYIRAAEPVVDPVIHSAFPLLGLPRLEY